jgi:hypothetical protein
MHSIGVRSFINVVFILLHSSKVSKFSEHYSLLTPNKTEKNLWKKLESHQLNFTTNNSNYHKFLLIFEAGFSNIWQRKFPKKEQQLFGIIWKYL